jgi:hypothetical protein
MDPHAPVLGDWDPAIDAILVRARALTDAEIVTLARGYVAPPQTGFDRVRVLAIARARADRPTQIRALESGVAESIGASLSAPAVRALRRLGLMEIAERAVTDAALAVLLRDRLGPPMAAAISRPWSDLA